MVCIYKSHIIVQLLIKVSCNDKDTTRARLLFFLRRSEEEEEEKAALQRPRKFREEATCQHFAGARKHEKMAAFHTTHELSPKVLWDVLVYVRICLRGENSTWHL